MIFDFTVSNQELNQVKPGDIPFTDSVDYLKARFMFCSNDWNGLKKVAQFSQGCRTYDMPLDENGMCNMPNELLPGIVKISVFGQEPGTTLRITTGEYTLRQRQSGYKNDGETPIPPTPDLYSQLLDELMSVEELNEAVEAARDAAREAIAEAEDARSQIASMNTALESLSLEVANKIDDGYVENNSLYLTSNGEQKAGPFTGFGGSGSGSGSGNNATLTLKNTTGWLAKTLAQNSVCDLSFNWSSVEDGLETGTGILSIVVNNASKLSRDINQGDVTIDVSPYLSTGSNSVKLSVSDVYGNKKTITFSVTVVAVSLSSAFDTSIAYSDAITYTYTPVGAVTKVMHFELDGNELDSVNVTASGRQQTCYIPKQSHGAHTLRVWFTATIGTDEVFSNELYHEIICVENGNTTPIITSSYSGGTVSQYATLSIPYQVYDPQQLETSVVLSANGESVSELAAVGRTVQTWSYRAQTVGDVELKISCGDVHKSILINVKEVEIDVAAETQDLELYLTSYGRSNSELNPGTWESNGIAAEFSGFNWTSDGWQTDEDGVTVLRVSGDARLNIPLKIFEKDFRTTGKTIEIEFASRNVLDYDAIIMSCLSDGRGFEITSQRSYLKSEQSEIGTQYKEDEHIRLSFVVEKRSDNRFVFIYLNGILSGVVQYPSGDDFSQLNPVEISIGSNDCTVDLYCIRVYNNALTRYQILNNWIADTQNAEQMIERYERNVVYDDYGQVVIDKLPDDLAYLIIKSATQPQFKDDKKTCSGQYVNPINPEKSFTFEGAQIDVQGTSSQYYYVKNYKIKFKGGFTLSDGTTSATYQFNDNAVPTSTYTFKADVASSEGANNVILAKLYNDICPVKTPPQENDPRVRQTIDGYPIVVFWDNGDGNYKFLGKYNFNNDKGTAEVFGFSSGDESWEIRQNGTDRVGFHSADFSAGSGWENDFEARFPEDNTDTTNLAAFAAWVASTDPDQATGEKLASSVNYDGIEYTNDTAEYRLAKFSFELEDHADVDALVFYYVFTEIFLCIDQREKNAFPTLFDALKLWLVLFYDADSSLGIDNKGNLAFDYYLEDIDYTEAGDPVFNGQNSVLWANLRKTKYDKITAEYQRLRTELRGDGSKDPLISYDVVNNMFESHQNTWPEAIFNEDGYRKSLEPMIVGGDGLYLPMLQGKKELQRKWWLYNRFRYLDSKYCTGTSMTNRITIRAHAQANINLVSYVNMYGHVFYNSEMVEHRMYRGQEYEFVWAASGAEDPVIGINDADMLTSLGDLSPLMVELIDASKAIHLTSLKIGDASEDYVNDNLNTITLGNNTLLKSLDARNCVSMSSPVDASGCTNIEEVYFDGTAITSISLPNGGVLNTLHLPGTITNLTILNQKKISDFVLPQDGYANITTIRLENVSDAIPTTDILNAIPANSRVRIIGFDWTMDSAEDILSLYDYLDTMRGLDENDGEMATAQLSGTIHVDSQTGAQLAEMQERYPYIKIDYNHITSYCYFYNYDGTTLLYTAAVQDGANATYSGSTPSRSSTAQYKYMFVGWSKSKNATSADSNALTAVTADRNVYAAFSATIQTYTVYFYNGSTLLQTITNVPYGGSATYTGETPVDTENGLPFEGWSPSPTSISGNTSCYAQFTSPREVKEITDDWATIFASIDDGTYATKYKAGNYKALDLGSEGVVNMQIAGIDKDVKADGSGTVPISWISEQLLKTSRRMNPSYVITYDYKEQAATTSSNNNSSVNANTTKTTSFRTYIQAGEVAEITNTINVTADGTLTITYKGLASSYGTLDVLVNGEAIVSDYASTTSVAYTMDVVSGDTVTVVGQFASAQASSSSASVAFMSTGTFTITTECNNVVSRYQTGYQEGTGSIGGWEKSEMRAYLKETILPLIPEEVRTRIVTVTKTHPAYNTAGSSFTQTTEDDVWIPSYAEVVGSSSLYKSLFENTSANRIKYKVGSSSATNWWLRSAGIGVLGFWYVLSGGGSSGNGAGNSCAVALGFCT